MSIICESGIRHVAGYFVEQLYNQYTKNISSKVGYFVHEYFVEPIFDYMICNGNPVDVLKNIIINKLNFMDILLTIAKSYINYKISVDINKSLASYLEVEIIPMKYSIFIIAPFVIISSKVASSSFDYCMEYLLSNVYTSDNSTYTIPKNNYMDSNTHSNELQCGIIDWYSNVTEPDGEENFN
jgi:hypothetical protein